MVFLLLYKGIANYSFIGAFAWGKIAFPIIK